MEEYEVAGEGLTVDTGETEEDLVEYLKTALEMEVD